MKKIFNLFATFAMTALAFTACGPDNPTPTPPAPEPDPNNPGGTTEELKADFSFEVDGLTVQFTNASKGATAYLWNFGDENTATDASPEHTYDAAGTYTVKLTVQDADGNSKSTEKEVTVAGAVKAYFTATAQTDRAGKFGKIFTLDATASENAASIVWDFGDGSEASTEFTVKHEFPEFGKTYTVKATVTGEAGDTDVFEETVEVIGYNELLKGGSMEEDDAQYWTWVSADASFSNDHETPYEPNVGTPSFVTEFGYTADGPSGGKGGCLRIGGENQFHDWGNNYTIYQAIELEEGDIVQFSAQLKWGENTNDCGLLWLNIGTEPTANDDNIFVQFFNWWDAAGHSVPAYDGDLTGSEGYTQGDQYGFSSPVDALGEGTGVCYTAPATGTYYVMFEVRNVWSTMCFGKDYFIDEVSAKIVL